MLVSDTSMSFPPAETGDGWAEEEEHALDAAAARVSTPGAANAIPGAALHPAGLGCARRA